LRERKCGDGVCGGVRCLQAFSAVPLPMNHGRDVFREGAEVLADGRDGNQIKKWSAGATTTTRGGAYAPRATARSRLIRCFVRFGLPFFEHGKGVAAEQRFHGDFTLRNRQRDFVVNEIVIKTNRRRVLAGVGEIDFFDARPVNGREAHGAGLATGVEFAIVELESLQPRACGANRGHFSMRGGVIENDDLV